MGSFTNATAITLFVSDIKRSTEFYSSVFGGTPIFADDVSTAYKFGGIIVNLLAQTEAVELITPAKVGDPGTGSRVQLTVSVDNCDAAVAEVTAHGATILNGPIDRPWGPRTAAFADPDGHVWELAAESKDAGS
jgi:catechol 2,3-dioxygenase-like lactoylglutathione lyase family enzyme